jgi:uncharacterized Tic20 family protein
MSDCVPEDMLLLALSVVLPEVMNIVSRPCATWMMTSRGRNWVMFVPTASENFQVFAAIFIIISGIGPFYRCYFL